MAETPTIQTPLGYKAPEFSLPDTVSGNTLNYSQIRGEKGTVVMFICNHCPYVIHVIEELVKLANDYIPKGIGFVAISSNDIINYPQDAPDKMKEHAAKWGLSFPYLYDERQEVAKAYQAACTPDYHLFDEEDKAVYRGQLDDSRPRNKEAVNGRDIREALDKILAGQKVNKKQKPSVGCGIKWKKDDGLKPIF